MRDAEAGFQLPVRRSGRSSYFSPLTTPCALIVLISCVCPGCPHNGHAAAEQIEEQLLALRQPVAGAPEPAGALKRHADDPRGLKPMVTRGTEAAGDDWK